MLESDLSIPLQNYLKSLGYCVHGEVTVFDRTRVIDHVAHLGPCESPTYIVSFELKSSYKPDLVKQLQRNDKGHFQHAQYAVMPSLTAKALNAYLGALNAKSWYLVPGLLTFDLKGNPDISNFIDCQVGTLPQKYLLKGSPRLLLCSDNQGVLGGVRLAKGQSMVTHWEQNLKVLKSFKAKNINPTLEDFKTYVNQENPNTMKLYKNRTALVRRLWKSY
jgi:hypothetical protein